MKITDRETFEAVQKFIINNFGAATSINGLCESLRKNGMTITKPSVPRYFFTMRMEREKTLHSERQRN